MNMGAQTFLVVMVLLFGSFGIYRCSTGTEKQNERMVTGVVKEVGHCHRGTIDECKLVVQVGNTTEYWTAYGTYAKGETIQRACWDEVSKERTRGMCRVPSN